MPRRAFSIYDGATSQRVELPAMNLSEVYDLAPGGITLHLLLNPLAAEQSIPAGAPSVSIPAAVTDCYLLVASDPKNTVTPLKFQMVNASPADFRVGQMMWLNLTGYEIGGQLGDKRLNLKPNSQGILDAPKGDAGSFPVRIGYLPEKDRKPVVLVDTQWVCNPTGRDLLFVMMLPEGKIPRIRGFADIREPVDNKAAL